MDAYLISQVFIIICGSIDWHLKLQIDDNIEHLKLYIQCLIQYLKIF